MNIAEKHVLKFLAGKFHDYLALWGSYPQDRAAFSPGLRKNEQRPGLRAGVAACSSPNSWAYTSSACQLAPGKTRLRACQDLGRRLTWADKLVGKSSSGNGCRIDEDLKCKARRKSLFAGLEESEYL